MTYEAELCACGFHSSLTDPENGHAFTFVERRCPVCAAAAKYGRIQDANDDAAAKAAGENAPPTADKPGDGRRTFMRRMTAAEVADRKARAASTTTKTKGGRHRGNTKRARRP